MKTMKAQFFAGVLVAAMALLGLWTYAFWGGEVKKESSLSQEAITQFTEAVRAKVNAEVGRPIEGYEPSMLMQAFPALAPQDFDGVDALIGGYVYTDGQVVYDLKGEQELHSAARAISDEGMATLLFNVAARLKFDLSGSETVEDVLRALGTATVSGGVSGGGNMGSDPNGTVSSPPMAGGTVPADFEPADGPRVTKTGVITCLPHKGDGPHTMECAFGLKADDGTYYGLRNLWEVAPGMTDTNVEVSVSGVYSAAPANEKYDIAGYLDVRSVEKK